MPTRLASAAASRTDDLAHDIVLEDFCAFRPNSDQANVRLRVGNSYCSIKQFENYANERPIADVSNRDAELVWNT